MRARHDDGGGPSLPRGLPGALPAHAAVSCRGVGGFATQLWWGAIRILVFAAFYGVNAAAAPISFTDAVTYVWLGQALLALQPWSADPEIGQAVRTGGVGYDRLGRSTPTATGMRAAWAGCWPAPCRARC